MQLLNFVILFNTTISIAHIYFTFHTVFWKQPFLDRVDLHYLSYSVTSLKSSFIIEHMLYTVKQWLPTFFLLQDPKFGTAAALYITSDPMNVVRNNGPLSNTFFLRCTINDAKGGFGKSVEAIVNVDA